MASPLTETEKDALAIAIAEGRIIRLRDRIARLRPSRQASEIYESLLETLEQSLELRRERLARRQSDLVAYRCYMMTGDHIKGVEVLRCPDDAEAMVRGADLLDARPERESVEIWDRSRLVGRVVRPG